MITDVFCKIIRGELPAQTVHQDDDFIVIKDISPQAPVHLLIVPKEHIERLDECTTPARIALMGRALALADTVAHQAGLDRGYRLIINEGDHGGKLVPHLHIHLLGGKHLGAKLVK